MLRIVVAATCAAWHPPALVASALIRVAAGDAYRYSAQCDFDCTYGIHTCAVLCLYARASDLPPATRSDRSSLVAHISSDLHWRYLGLKKPRLSGGVSSLTRQKSISRHTKHALLLHLWIIAAAADAPAGSESSKSTSTFVHGAA